MMRKRFQIIIVLMCLSLFGLILIQGLWIKYAISTEKAKFDQLVYDAMKNALSNIEQRNVYEFIDERIELPEPDINISLSWESLNEMEEALEELKEVEFLNHTEIADIEHQIHHYSDSSSNNTYFFSSDEEHSHNGVVVINSSDGTKYEFFNGDSTIILDEIDKDRVIRIRTTDSIEDIIKFESDKILIEKEKLVKHKLEAFNENIEQWVMEYRFDNDFIHLSDRFKDYEGVLADALINNGINLLFDYQVIHEDDTVVSVYSSIGDSLILPYQYKTEVFPKEIFTKGLFLLLNFPAKNSHIYGKVYILVIGSLIFTIIIILTFGITLYYIQKQKKLSEVKSDFINNMTHEFKTPIATIRLAADALESPKVIGIEKPTLYYLKIIRQENSRMNNQVERVLQMALIDQGQLHVDIQNNDLHGIIENCVNVVELTAQKKKGKISTSLRATCFNINIDEIHMANVINNLLDNAIKYTELPPDILIETYNKDDDIFIRVSDNGMGMNKDVQKHIFDKFYRKPTGNIHNIKGFGLGLSYVKAVIEAHNGHISVTSEPDNGSTFLLKFSCLKNNDES